MKKRRTNFIFRVGLVLAWLFLIAFFNRGGGVWIDHAAEAQSTVPFYIHAPWPAPLEWHAGGDGSYYDTPPAHSGTDKYALDFNGPSDSDRGAIVLAITDGIVLKAGDYGDGYGYQVVLGHAYCYESRYAHFKNVLVSEGQWVAQGEPLGLVGSTGQADGSHLHFAMYHSETCESGNRVSAKPEPMEGQIPIEDGMHITSRNYGVGYEAIADPHDFTGLVKHESFISTYRMFGGRFWTFGPTSTPIQVWPGTEFRYQEFMPQDLPGLPWSGFGSAMMENEGTAYFVTGPIWEMYKRAGGPNSFWGPPITHSYEWRQEDVPGYRSDFVNGSIIWLDNGQPKFLHEENASWRAEFFDRPNTFDGPSKRRFDQYLDFEWQAGDSPGPVITFNGFSAKWETDVGGLISAYRLLATVQGHLEVLVDGKPALSCNSPDKIWEGQSIELGIGTEHVEVRFWQEGGKAAMIEVTVSGLIVPPAFASEGKITSSLPVNPQVGYASFEPPPFPIPARSSSKEFYGTAFDETGHRFSRGGDASDWHEGSSGYNRHTWWTYNSQDVDDNWGKWLLNPTTEGYWEVFVFIPAEHATTANAGYQIVHNQEMEVVHLNQSVYDDVWVSLGTFHFAAQGDEYIQLGDATGEPPGSAQVALDAVGIDWRGDQPPLEEIEKQFREICPGGVAPLAIAVLLAMVRRKSSLLSLSRVKSCRPPTLL